MMNCQNLRISSRGISKQFVSSLLLILLLPAARLGAEEIAPTALELPRPKTATSGSGTVDPVTWMAVDPEADPYQTMIRNHPENRLKNQLATLDLIWPSEYQKRKPRPVKVVLELEKSIRAALNPKDLAEMMREDKSPELREAERNAVFAIMFPQSAQAGQQWIP